MTNKYAAYKESGEGWLGEIPSNWQVLRLKHIFNEKKIIHNQFLSCGAISFGEVITKSDDKIPHSTKASYQEVLKGEYLINPLNLNYDLKSLRIALSGLDVVVSSGYIVINNHIKINKTYYKWLLHRYDVAYMKLLGSGVRQTINFNHIANSLLPYPSDQEQTAIANFLDQKTTKIDQAIAQKEQLIALLKERKQILIQNLVTGKQVWNKQKNAWTEPAQVKDSGVKWIGEIPVGWEVRQIKTIANTVSGGTPSSGNRKRYYNGIYPWIRTTDLNNDILSEVPEKITKEALRETACKIIPKNTICIAMYGGSGTIGKFSLINFKNATLNQAVCGIISNSKINNMFLYYSLQMMRIHWMFYADGSRKDPNISQDIIRNMPIVYPFILEQKRISEHIEKESAKIENSISLNQTQIAKLKEYKSTLINSAVTGKIRVV